MLVQGFKRACGAGSIGLTAWFKGYGSALMPYCVIAGVRKLKVKGFKGSIAL
jgi:hypothetical protein